MTSASSSLSRKAWILGFDIGGTKTAVLAGTQDGQVIDRLAFASKPERGFAAMWEDLAATGQTMIARHGRPAAIGVSIGGPMDFSTGTINSPPNLPGWDAIPLKHLLEQTFGVPAYVEHDAKACALAEWLFGAGQGFKDMVFLTFGTGLGAGLILDGRLYRGANDSAGFVGHWRIAEDGPYIWGKSGSWEGYSSGAGLAALTEYLYPGFFPAHTSAAEIIQRARAGEAQPKTIIETSAKALGRGIALLIDLLNPQVIVLGSLAVRAGDLFLPIVEHVIAQEASPEGRSICKIVPAGLGEQVGDVAALCAAFYHAGLLERGSR